MIVLGIESSCDDTAVAVVDSQKKILSNVISSQIKQHANFGGVVPEIAARSHIESLPILFKQALNEAQIIPEKIDAIAVTSGPGLVGGLIVGMMFAKGLSSMLNKPFIPVNHLQGHALTIRLVSNIKFPYLIVLASGGHTQILIAEEVEKYHLLATTLDDSIGEAFDKVAKMLNLGYPGGPIVEKFAKNGNPHKFEFPKPLCSKKSSDYNNFSLSGLKTAVKQTVAQGDIENHQFKSDICASFQYTIAKILLFKLEIAINEFSKHHPQARDIVISGGVASNQYIRNKLSSYLKNKGYNFIAPPIKLCTDNAAMIAWAGLEKFKLGHSADLSFSPKSRWPL